MITKQQKAIFEKARLSRDPRFDGKFFVAVKTTGIYCRSICPVKLPKVENIDFHLTAVSATEAGFRPCLRCRPESAPKSPAWNGTSTTVSRALRLISEGYLNDDSVNSLADKLGVTERHLTRLFQQHLSLTPIALAQYHRLQKAKLLLDQSHLPMTEVAAISGYQSVRRFNSHIKSIYQLTPNELRKKAKYKKSKQQNYLQFTLAYRPPYDWQKIINFLAVRAAPGVESVQENVNGEMSYHRVITINDDIGLIDVFHHEKKSAIVCRIYHLSAKHIFTCIERIKHIFDVNSDIGEIYRVLKKDKVMAGLIKDQPGLRVPGCWHPFEIIVRAIIGQQVSVVGATTVLGRLVKSYGQPVDDVLPKDLTDYAASLGLYYQYPTPLRLSRLDTKTLSMPESRAGAIKTMAASVEGGAVDLSSENLTTNTSENLRENLSNRLLAIKGIGPWTVQYVIMRALDDPDAFLLGDLVLQKNAAILYGFDQRLNDKQLAQLAQQWRPWRAYASMMIWNGLDTSKPKSQSQKVKARKSKLESQS